MENENELQEGDEILELPEVAEGEEDATDWRAEAEKLQQKAIRQREKTKTYKAKIAELEALQPKQSNKQEIKSDEITFNSGDKALLKSYKDIKGTDELALASNWMKRTGDSLETMLEDEIFNSKLNSLREIKAAKDAMPASSKRATGDFAKNQIDYWLDKPFAEVPQELKREVLNAQLKNQEQKNKFGG